LLLQNRGYKVFGASLRKLAARLLALLFLEIVGVLAKIPELVLIFAPS
jgi:hypothetical protein